MTSLLGKRLAVVLACVLLLAVTPAVFAAAPAAIIIPVSSGTVGWENINYDAGTSTWVSAPTPSGTRGAFVKAPTTLVLGSGSFHQVVGTNGNDAQRLQFSGLNGTALSTITELTYSTYVTTPGGQATYLQLAVDYTGDGAQDDRLFFEPVYQSGGYSGTPVPNQCAAIPNCVALNTWQTWDAKVGGWWLVSGAGGPPLITLADFITAHPTAAIVSTGYGFRLQAGGGAGAWTTSMVMWTT